MQLELTCLNKKRAMSELSKQWGTPNMSKDTLHICVGTQPRKNRLYVYDKLSGKWVVGFPSYDGRGIVYWSPRTHRYMFSGIVLEKNEIHNRQLGHHGGGGTSCLIFEDRLQQGIANERVLCQDLQSVDSGYYVHHLERSGLHAHGSDIVISKQKLPSETPFETVSDGVCAIEVVGVTVRDVDRCKPSLIYHKDKNLDEWRQELIENNVLPVIAWYYEGNCYYVVLTDDVLYEGFYITTKAKGFHQQHNNVPVRRLEPYLLNVNQLFYCIDCHVKTIGILKEIEGNIPLVFENSTSVSNDFKHKNPMNYEHAISDIKRKGFTGEYNEENEG